MRIPQKIQAFTLIELLLVVSTLVILTAFFVSASADLQEHSKIAKVKHTFTQIANAIQSFQQDWDKLPDSLSQLVNPKSLIDLAKNKKVSITSTKPYLTGIPETSGLGDITRYSCPLYVQGNPENLPPSKKFTYSEHFHDLTLKEWADNTNSSDSCSVLLSTGSMCLKKHKGVTTFSTNSTAERRISDAFGSIIYYLKKNDGSYLLISPGADEKIAGSVDAMKALYNNTANATYDEKSSAPEDKDNIVFKSNI